MVGLGRLLACQESLQVTACFAFMESSDDSSHIFVIFFVSSIAARFRSVFRSLLVLAVVMEVAN